MGRDRSRRPFPTRLVAARTEMTGVTARARGRQTMNTISITGRLTGDPSRRETAKGVVTSFRIGSDTTPRVWLDVECWGHLAGTCAAHLARGRHVGVSGPLAHA